MKNFRRAVAVAAMALCFSLALPRLLHASVSTSATAVLQAPPASTATTSARPPQATPQELYHQVWKLAYDNFLWRDRLAGWQSWEHKYDGKLNSVNDAEKAIAQMLSSLHDTYTFFKDEGQTRGLDSEEDDTNVVIHRMLPGNIGYVKIITFGSKHTAAEAEAALRALSGADAYVLDLRDDGGGFVDQAQQVFAMFVDRGKFTSLIGRYDGKPYDEELSVSDKELVDQEPDAVTRSPRVPNLTGRKPVIVLVNDETASASEMISGALRDDGRAELLGIKTFGKGIAQVTWKLDYGTSVQVTIARYYLPKGACIHGVSLIPDYIVQPTARQDLQLSEAEHILLRKLGK